MAKKLVITMVVFVLLGACVFGVGALASSQVSAPQPITPDAPCPATGCASGACHGFGNVPEPDSVHTMVCPEVGCASVECHAWDSLVDGGYRAASDASLNLWILAPVVLVAALAFIVRKAR